MSKDRLKLRHIDSLEGWISFKRMRYYCRECRKGFYPFDEELKVGKESRMSLKKERQLAKLAVRIPYEEAKAVYEELTHTKVGRMTAHRSVQRLGKKLQESQNVLESQSPAIKEEGNKGKEHVTADGTMVHFRGEGWKETKVGAYYRVDEERRARDIFYTATLGPRAELGLRLYHLSGEPLLEQTGEMAFVSDAAEWLSEMQQEHFPLATAIVDFYHASEYVWKAAKSFYGESSLKTRQWAEEKIKQLEAGDQRGLQRSFSKMKPKTEEQKESLKVVRRYFRNHGSKMDYPRYKNRGLHIGSGIAEGACKHVVGARFKQAGMRWSRPGAGHLLHLRLAHLNNQWNLVAACQLN